MTEKQIIELLKRNNLSVTKTRVKIMSCLADDVHFHTIKEISEHEGGLNTKTIYNNIKALVDSGIVESYSFKGVSKFAIDDNIDGDYEMHLISSDDDVNHLKVPKVVIDRIKEEVKKNGHNIKKIKISVEID